MGVRPPQEVIIKRATTHFTAEHHNAPGAPSRAKMEGLGRQSAAAAPNDCARAPTGSGGPCPTDDPTPQLPSREKSASRSMHCAPYESSSSLAGVFASAGSLTSVLTKMASTRAASSPSADRAVRTLSSSQS
jgi:hypothetical protein